MAVSVEEANVASSEIRATLDLARGPVALEADPIPKRVGGRDQAGDCPHARVIVYRFRRSIKMRG